MNKLFEKITETLNKGVDIRTENSDYLSCKTTEQVLENLFKYKLIYLIEEPKKGSDTNFMHVLSLLYENKVLWETKLMDKEGTVVYEKIFTINLRYILINYTENCKIQGVYKNYYDALKSLISIKDKLKKETNKEIKEIKKESLPFENNIRIVHGLTDEREENLLCSIIEFIV